MLSRRAQATWLTSIREVESNLCDGEALCLVKDDDHPDVYRMLFNARGLIRWMKPKRQLQFTMSMT